MTRHAPVSYADQNAINDPQSHVMLRSSTTKHPLETGGVRVPSLWRDASPRTLSMTLRRRAFEANALTPDIANA